MLTGFLAAMMILLGFLMLVIGQRVIGVLCGLSVTPLVVQSYKECIHVLTISGKILTQDWFGLGDYKGIAVIYGLTLAGGIAIVLAGIILLIRKRKERLPAEGGIPAR